MKQLNSFFLCFTFFLSRFDPPRLPQPLVLFGLPRSDVTWNNNNNLPRSWRPRWMRFRMQRWVGWNKNWWDIFSRWVFSITLMFFSFCLLSLGEWFFPKRSIIHVSSIKCRQWNFCVRFKDASNLHGGRTAPVIWDRQDLAHLSMLRVGNLRFKSLPKKLDSSDGSDWMSNFCFWIYKKTASFPLRKRGKVIFRGKLIVLGRVNNFGERKTLLVSSEDHIFDNLTRRISRQSEFLWHQTPSHQQIGYV